MRLLLKPLSGTGTMKLVVNRPSGAPPVIELHATLIGRDGSAVGLDGQAETVTLPAGEYRIGTLWIALDDQTGGPRWNFTFSDDDGKPDQKWYKIDDGDAIEIDPIGRLELHAGLKLEGKPALAGDDITLEPKLYTGDGLSINTCFRGSPASPGGQDGQGAEITLCGAGQQTLALARSGFS